MPVTPITPSGPLNTLIDRLVLGIEERINLTIVSTDGKGHRIITNDLRTAVREAIAAIIRDLIAADTNTTVKTRLQTALNSIDPGS